MFDGCGTDLFTYVCIFAYRVFNEALLLYSPTPNPKDWMRWDCYAALCVLVISYTADVPVVRQLVILACCWLTFRCGEEWVWSLYVFGGVGVLSVAMSGQVEVVTMLVVTAVGCVM